MEGHVSSSKEGILLLDSGVAYAYWTENLYYSNIRLYSFYFDSDTIWRKIWTQEINRQLTIRSLLIYIVFTPCLFCTRVRNYCCDSSIVTNFRNNHSVLIESQCSNWMYLVDTMRRAQTPNDFVAMCAIICGTIMIKWKNFTSILINLSIKSFLDRSYHFNQFKSSWTYFKPL